MIESKSKLYDRIERLCREKGKNIKTMCSETGISTGMMSDLKSGRTGSLSIPTILKIAECLNVSTDLILGR